jgi:NAD(P)-dependent dehydrogenase (short-subunit alcohol dehydrogenase family)
VTLRGKVALVTGASRGVGKGIALALASEGATVYVTGRSVDGRPTGSLAGTVEETAREAAARGGEAVTVHCDHRDDEQVRALFEQVERECGGLDLLVNNVWGGYELLHEGQYELFVKPFWEQPLSLWDAMFAAGVRAHYVASTLAAPLLIGRGGGLIVNVSSFAGAGSEDNVALGVAKGATDRLARSTARDLQEFGVSVVALCPGLVRTEGILKWQDFIDLSNSESPELAGRAVAALASDPDVMQRSGEVLVVAELAREYGFTDVDGAQPESLRPQFEGVR